MDRNQGRTLDRYLADRGSLDPTQVIRIALELAQQASAGTDSSIVHPGRILVGKDGTVRLLPLPVEDLALPAIVEFPAYASPEQIRGGAPDTRSSLYSLGCTLFELLAGQPPYGGQDPRTVLKAHVEAPVPDIHKLCKDIPSSLVELLTELLEKDPELRIQSYQELVRRLRQASIHGGATTKPASAAPPARAPSPRAPSARTARTPPAMPPRVPSAPVLKRSPRRSAGQVRGAAAASRRPRASTRSRPAQERSRADHVREGRPSREQRRAGAKSRIKSSRGKLQRDRAAPVNYLDLEGELDEEEKGPVIRRKKVYPFSIGGAALGFLIGIALVFSSVRASKQVPERERQVVEEATTKHLESRKKALSDELAQQKKTIQRHTAKLPNVQEDMRRDFLVEVLRDSCTFPNAFQLARELISLGPPPGTPGAAGDSKETTEQADAYANQLAEAQKLYDAGKYAAARDKMYEDYNINKFHHDTEVTAFMEECDEKMVARWETDQEEIDSLVVRGSLEKALDLCKTALEYGDDGIRKEVNQRIRSLQNQLDFQGTETASGNDKPTGEDPVDPPETSEEDEISALEKEFEDFGSDKESSKPDPDDGWDKELDDEEL